jgi:hypothetical protein
MRAPGTAALLALLLAGCGGLSNGPLDVGTVRGTVSSSDGTGSVSIIAAGLTQSLDTTGAFQLVDVPVGTNQVFVIATHNLALRAPAPVQGGRATDLGTLVPLQAFGVNIHIVNTLSNPELATATIDQTPFHGQSFDHSGHVRIGPLPADCYTGTVIHPTAGTVALTFCQSDQQDDQVDANLQ